MGNTPGDPFTVSDHEGPTVVPDDIARLMYYLNCVTLGLGMDILQDDLVAYKKYQSLSTTRSSHVLQAAVRYSPDEFIDKVIFRDNDSTFIQRSSNAFLTVDTASAFVSVDREHFYRGAYLEGKKSDVLQVIVA